MRRTLVGAVAALAVILAAGPAAAAPPVHETEHFVGSDPELAAALRDHCYGSHDPEDGIDDRPTFDVQVDFRVLIKEFATKNQGRRQLERIEVYKIRFVITNEQGERLELFDVGPDQYYTVDGVPHLAITGRSITGSGVIGHVVINLQSGQPVHIAGQDQGFFFDTVCDALA